MSLEIQPLYVVLVTNDNNDEFYSYSDTDTVGEFKEKIFSKEDFPVDHQRLFVKYGWKRLWSHVEITDKNDELIINYLRTAIKINLFVKFSEKK